ncbi:Kunitz/Bovine pancreatic trypsin inhibitor domain protein [Oesophagostomum dentatum]|uniref:Kunitz/Bovine pancreatic trypsin inhibitor domain protein n=1 Tax=Oesophagostomum dentatum TaxID=61180 RepID=A0A0B1SXZ9_OESDE|nr:Kunitz/Bovine pancreatic trypsin inhibitor domain protein [Oesophagostomum dentatum]
MCLLFLIFSVLTIIPLAQQLNIFGITDVDCSAPLNRGHDFCKDGSPAHRFYYDTTLGKCLSFLYKGCGGNLNNYPTLSDCESKCTKAETVRCGGGNEAMGRCTTMEDCPTDSICRKSASESGICCDAKVEVDYEKELHPKCNEKQLMKVRTEKGRVPLLGKNCTHKFCPMDFECIQGQYLAHCCGSFMRFRLHQVSEDTYKILVRP